MEIKKKMTEDVLVLAITGELMGGNESDQFRKITDKTIQDEHVFVVVDMEKATWMNSSGLGMLISALTSLRSSGGDLALANLTERVRRPLQITKLDLVFQEYDSVEAAVKRFEKGD